MKREAKDRNKNKINVNKKIGLDTWHIQKHCDSNFVDHARPQSPLMYMSTPMACVQTSSWSLFHTCKSAPFFSLSQPDLSKDIPGLSLFTRGGQRSGFLKETRKHPCPRTLKIYTSLPPHFPSIFLTPTTQLSIFFFFFCILYSSFPPSFFPVSSLSLFQQRSSGYFLKRRCTFDLLIRKVLNAFVKICIRLCYKCVILFYWPLVTVGNIGCFHCNKLTKFPTLIV